MTGPIPIRSEAGLACPPSLDWALLAAGNLQGERAEALLAHVTECDECGLTLRLATEAVNEYENATLKPAQDLAQRLAGKPAKAAPNVIEMPRRRVWAVVATIAAALAIVVGGVALRPTQLDPSTETLLAQAYTERRPFDFRIGDAAYAPIRVQRSSAEARPAALLQAEERLVSAKAGDAAALQLRARAEMLEFEPANAAATLLRALDRKPGDASLLADLGSAYAQAGDWTRAHEALSKALALQPNLAEAVFNRALVNQRRAARAEAIADWDRFLQLDSASGWAKEAREHREALDRSPAN